MKKIFENKKSLVIGLIILVFVAIGFGAYMLIPKHNVFVNGPKMNYPRFGSLATPLNDGNVLITGGKTLRGNINIAEIYNSKINKFELSGKMNTTRSYYNATLLNNGNVLITGGQSGRIEVSYAEIYNSNTKKFKLIKNMNEPRAGHRATLLNNGNVLITGGLGSYGSLSSAEIYDMNKKKFFKISKMNYPRTGHTATLLNNGNVLIVGGNGKTSKGEIYDVKTNSFKMTGSMRNARDGRHTATLLKDETVLIVGGTTNNIDILSSIEIFNPKDNSFKYIGNLNPKRASHTATLLEDGGVLVTGGTRPCSWAYCPMELAQIIYVKPNLEIKKINNMKIARSGHVATLLNNGNILITSGNGNKYTIEIYKQ